MIDLTLEMTSAQATGCIKTSVTPTTVLLKTTLTQTIAGQTISWFQTIYLTQSVYFLLQNPKSPRAMSAKRATSPQPPRNGSPTNRRPRSAAVPSSPRNREEEVEPASVAVQ